MLQQTRVDTVIPYYERFLARWPTAADMAAADEADVLSEWAGLGYYRRARNLLAAARAAAAGFPNTLDAIRALPGVGPYTAGAVASIAFGIPAPAIDGNVERVIARVDGNALDPKTAAGRRSFAARVGEITAEGVAGDVTQALMELGATVCTPKRPSCDPCPWTEHCASKDGGWETLPTKKRKKPPTPVFAAAGVLRSEHGVLMGKRPDGLLGGMWEPISTAFHSEPLAEGALRRAFAERAGATVTVGELLGEVTHVFSHRKLRLQVFAVNYTGPAAKNDGSYQALGWYPGSKGLSTLARKTLAAAKGHRPVAAEEWGSWPTV